MGVLDKSGGAYGQSVGVTNKRSGVYEAVAGVFAKSGGAYSSILGVVASASMRSKIISGQSGSVAGLEARIGRMYDKTNVQIRSPWFEFYDGRVLSSGVVGSSIETTVPTTTAPRKYRFAILTGVSGSAANQSSATVHRATFFGMLDDSAFVSAGGAVSENGEQITVPNGSRFRTDTIDVVLDAGESYFKQTECLVAAAGDSVPTFTLGGGSALGDRAASASTANAGIAVYSVDWSANGSSAASTTQSWCMPIAVLGTAPSGTKTVAVHGDSIICESAWNGTVSGDLGNAVGAQNFAKRALSEAGYSYIDVSVSGTNIGNFMAGYNKDGLRASLMQYCDAVITDHGHNDRRSGVAFDAVAGWSEASPSTWNSTGLKTRYNWHNDWLRTKIKAGGKIVACTLSPQTNSTDSWATTANQTGKNDDSTWVSDYDTNVTNGDQFKLADLIMHRGLYSSNVYGAAGEPDAGFDFYAAIEGTADGKFTVNGSANFATNDGTHPVLARQTMAADALKPLLPTLLGF